LNDEAATSAAGRLQSGLREFGIEIDSLMQATTCEVRPCAAGERRDEEEERKTERGRARFRQEAKVEIDRGTFERERKHFTRHFGGLIRVQSLKPFGRCFRFNRFDRYRSRRRVARRCRTMPRVHSEFKPRGISPSDKLCFSEAENTWDTEGPRVPFSSGQRHFRVWA
jgi:hypothetical protein